MFHAKEVYLFHNYYADKENKLQNKFGVVLHENDEFVVTLIITSSKDHYNLNGGYGCHKRTLTGGEEHCFCFPAKHLICTNEYAFSLNTYLYTKRSVVEKAKADLFAKDCTIKGVLKDDIYSDLLYCLMKSDDIAGKYIALFEEILENLHA